MKIALYSTQFFPSTPDLKGYGGLELIVGLLAKYFDEHGHEVHLFATKDSYIPKNGKLYSVAESGKVDEIQAWKEFSTNQESKKALLDADIIHDHSWQYAPYALYTERKGRICKTHHGPDPGFREEPPFPTMNLIGVSQNHAKNLMECEVIKDGKVAQLKSIWRGVENGIDLSKYPFKKEKQDYLLWTSRIFPPKGCHRFIDICDRLQMQGRIFGGSFGQDQNYIASLKKKIENSKYVKVVGNLGEAIPFEQKVELYQNAKAVVMPVVEDIIVEQNCYRFKEPFGLVAPEANSCGTPMVVTPSAGWNETTVHGLTGFFANTDEEFMYYIKRLDEILPNECSRHAYHFRYERMAEEYLKLYKEVIDGGGW